MKIKNNPTPVKSQKSKVKCRGFSLVELLVVITIIAILSVVAYTAVGGQTIKARDSKRKQDISAIQQALELYAIENANQYPANLNDLKPKYMPKGVPKDPGAKKRDYRYDRSGAKYEIAATLEVDGDVANYEAYVVGNGDGIIKTTSDAQYNNNGTLKACGAGLTMQSGKIGTSSGNNNCVPYDPNN